MGLLDDAIKEHLELKRRRGADPNEVERLEREALGPVRRSPQASEETVLEEDGVLNEAAPGVLDEAAAAHSDEEPVLYDDLADEAPAETPEFLQDTPDHDRLWFEQRPPKDFDFDK